MTARRVWWSVGSLCVLALGASVAARVMAPSDVARAKRTGRTASVVQMAPAQRGSLVLTGEHAGELDADAAELAAQTAGRLEEVRVRLGDVVKEGELLARVDASEAEQQVLEARAQVRIAEAEKQRVSAELGAARVELERTEPLSDDQLVSAQELDTLRAGVRALEAEALTASAQREQAQARIAVLRDRIRRASLRAPFDGAVAERYLDPGAVVQPGTAVLRLVRRGPLRVRFRVPERELGRISVGMPFELTSQATGAKHFRGEVMRLGAEVSREDRSLAVEGILGQDSDVLRPGSYVQVRLTYERLTDVVTLPAESVVDRVDDRGTTRTGVFVVQENHARWHPVRVLGTSAGTSAVEGLDAGLPVVILGQADLSDGAPVRVQGEG